MLRGWLYVVCLGREANTDVEPLRQELAAFRDATARQQGPQASGASINSRTDAQALPPGLLTPGTVNPYDGFDCADQARSARGAFGCFGNCVNPGGSLFGGDAAMPAAPFLPAQPAVPFPHGLGRGVRCSILLHLLFSFRLRSSNTWPSVPALASGLLCRIPPGWRLRAG